MAVQRAHSQAETAATTANINNTKEANDRAADVDVANTMAAAKAALNGQPLCDAEIVAYMYHPCPFCTKVRMFMDYYKLPYDKVEVDPLRKTQISFSAYKKVPIVLLNGVQINDSAAIVDTLYSLLPQEKQRPATTEEITWRKWADDFLVHLLPSNIYRTPRESLESFDYLMDSSFSLSTSARVLARYSGAAIMYLLVRFKLNAKYGVTDARSQLYDAIDGFINAIGGDRSLIAFLTDSLLRPKVLIRPA